MTFLMIKNFCKALENHEILQKKVNLEMMNKIEIYLGFLVVALDFEKATPYNNIFKKIKPI